MNVVHIFPYSPRISGGHSNAIRGFIECQRAQGIHAVGIAPAPDPASPVGCEPAAAFPLEEIDFRSDLLWDRIAPRFGLRPVDSLVHLHSVDSSLSPFLHDLGRVGVPYVLTSHGQLNFRNPAHWLKKFIYLHFVDRGIRRAAGLHFLTGYEQRRMRWLLPGYRGVSLLQPHPVEVPMPSGSQSDFRAKHGIPQNALLLLFLGRLDVHTKGLDVLLEALARVDSRFWLAMIGPDWNGGRERLEQQAERLHVRERTVFCGPAYGPEKWSALQGADVFAVPSRWDSFNISMAEAMGFGMPVIASERINLAEDLRKAGAALVAALNGRAFANAMTRLADSKEMRRDIGARGQAWVKASCSCITAGIRFRDFYRSLLERSPR